MDRYTPTGRGSHRCAYRPRAGALGERERFPDDSCAISGGNVRLSHCPRHQHGAVQNSFPRLLILLGHKPVCSTPCASRIHSTTATKRDTDRVGAHAPSWEWRVTVGAVFTCTGVEPRLLLPIWGHAAVDRLPSCLSAHVTVPRRGKAAGCSTFRRRWTGARPRKGQHQGDVKSRPRNRLLVVAQVSAVMTERHTADGDVPAAGISQRAPLHRPRSFLRPVPPVFTFLAQ
jgi:hypothetical protein